MKKYARLVPVWQHGHRAASRGGEKRKRGRPPFKRMRWGSTARLARSLKTDRRTRWQERILQRENSEQRFARPGVNTPRFIAQGRVLGPGSTSKRAGPSNGHLCWRRNQWPGDGPPHIKESGITPQSTTASIKFSQIWTKRNPWRALPRKEAEAPKDRKI